MNKTVIAACAAALASASFAFADDVIIRQTDPEPTNSIIIKEKQGKRSVPCALTRSA